MFHILDLKIDYFKDNLDLLFSHGDLTLKSMKTGTRSLFTICPGRCLVHWLA